MSSFPPVESVVRAFAVLKALNRSPVSSLDAIYHHTGLPKPSLVRLLQTLCSIGLVRPGPQRGTYLLTSEVRTLAAGYHGEPRAVECAIPVLDDLTARLKWPLALAMFDGNAVVVRYSTIALSQLSLLHSAIGLRHSLASRALGRAYLAFCEPDVREDISAVLRASDNPEDAPARNRRDFAALLEDVRNNGYAVRNPKVRPVSNTIAVPVFDHGHVMASIGLTYFSSTMPVATALERFLPELLEAANRISLRLFTLDAEDVSEREN